MRKLVDWWCPVICEGDEDATQAEFIRQFSEGLRKISVIADATLREWEARRQHPEAQKPFPAYMGRRPLEARYEKSVARAHSALEFVP